MNHKHKLRICRSSQCYYFSQELAGVTDGEGDPSIFPEPPEDFQKAKGKLKTKFKGFYTCTTGY